MFNKFMQSVFFFNMEVFLNNQQSYNSNELYAHKSYISNNFEGAISEYKGWWQSRLTTVWSLLLKEVENACRKWRIYDIRQLGSWFCHNLFFYMISDNPNISLGIVDCWLYTRRIRLREDYHKQRTDMFADDPLEYNSMEVLAKIFINQIKKIPLRKYFQQGSHSENPVSHENKLCSHWFFHWEPAFVSIIRSQTN